MAEAPGNDDHTAIAAMSPPRPSAPAISALLARLSPPRILAHNLPRYRQSLSSPPAEGISREDGSTRVEQAADSGHPASVLPRYVEWSTLVPSPEALLSSFGSIFRPSSGSPAASTSVNQPVVPISPSASPLSPPPRLVFFGEQHHQPEVLRAQLQTLAALHAQCIASSSSHFGVATEKRTQYRLHLVLEHFSIEDQPMLRSFSAGQLSPAALIAAYSQKSEEGFDLSHYMPLLLLARELGVPIWGGFPPRRWARDMFRDGVDKVRRSEREFLDATAAVQGPGRDSSPAAAAEGKGRDVPRMSDWSMVTHLHAAHRSYLSSLMRPDVPPRFPRVPPPSGDSSNRGMDAGDAAAVSLSDSTPSAGAQPLPSDGVFPTWLLRRATESTVPETKGFAPAQALKDSFFAHVTAWLLRGGGSAVTPQSATSSGEPSLLLRRDTAEADSGVGEEQVLNATLCIAGLGHVEYGLGAPERVVHLLRGYPSPFSSPSPPSPPPGEAKTGKGGAEGDIVPLIIASKPIDSGVWLSPASHAPSSCPNPSSTHPSTDKGEGYVDKEGERRWIQDPWERRVADVVVLYDWRDEEGEGEGEEPSQAERGHTA